MKLIKRIQCLFHGHEYVPYINAPDLKWYKRKLIMKCTHCGKEMKLTA